MTDLPLDPLHNERQELRQLARKLTENYMDSMIRSEALRVVLEGHGVITNPEFQSAVARLRADWDAKLAELQANAQSEEIQRILRELDSKPQ